ncbi:MAG: hypothetical protein HOW73_20195 [Polyangiaceae bacterium]|nr:hypothetical protein [Polyangiaceae bacterium]
MSRSKHARKQPLQKRYPGQWVMRSVVYTPAGIRIEGTGLVPEPAVGRLMVALMASSVGRLDPKVVAEIEQLAAKLEERPKKKRSAEG